MTRHILFFVALLIERKSYCHYYRKDYEVIERIELIGIYCAEYHKRRCKAGKAGNNESLYRSEVLAFSHNVYEDRNTYDIEGYDGKLVVFK